MTATGAALHCGPIASPAPLLAVRDLSLRFGGIVALDRVCFEIGEGEVVGLIGPNGAGKTTLFNCLTRLYTPDQGRITFAGRDLLHLPRHRVVGQGLSRTFQNVELFSSMSARENVMVGLHDRAPHIAAALAGAAGWPGARRSETALREQADEALAAVGLEGIGDRPVTGLPLGTLKAIELARAIASRPRLLLLDEPAGGLNHEEVARLGVLLRSLRRARAMTMLVVEHHVNLVMDLSDRVVVLSFGRKIADGAPRDIRSDPVVIEAYLGTAHGAA